MFQGIKTTDIVSSASAFFTASTGIPMAWLAYKPGFPRWLFTGDGLQQIMFVITSPGPHKSVLAFSCPGRGLAQDKNCQKLAQFDG